MPPYAGAWGAGTAESVLTGHAGRQVAKAKETTEKIDAELKDLQATLANIEEARPFEDLTVSGICCGALIKHF